MNAPRQATGPGPGVDAHGNPVYDPTHNVLDLVDAAVQRIDDMANLRTMIQDEKTESLRREQNLRAEIARLRADYQEKLDALEAKRLDAIRQVDQLAVKTEADRSAAAITALATTAATTAETLRNAVNTSASNLATQLDRTVTAITERIAALEKSSYEGMGKQKVADPQMERISSMVETLTRNRAQDAGAHGVSDPAMAAALANLIAKVDANTTKITAGAGQREGSDNTIKLAALIISMFVGLILIGTFVFVTSRTPAQQPIYYPAPVGSTLPTSPPTQVPR